LWHTQNLQGGTESLTHPFVGWGGALSSSAAGGEAAKMWP